MKSERYSSLEFLEARIAPASVISYYDTDGDFVKVIVNRGVLNAEEHATFSTPGTNGFKQLQMLDISEDQFARTSVNIVVKRAPGGDGLAHVGFINAAGNDLTSVIVRGDLGRIVAGDNNAGTPAIRSLLVNSMGAFGTLTQGGNTGGGTLPDNIDDLLEDLLGTGGVVPGLIDDLRGALNELLGDDSALSGLTSNLVRTITNTLSNMEVLDGLVQDGSLAGLLDGTGEGLIPNVVATVNGLLENIGQGLNTLLTPTNLPVLQDLADQLNLEDVLGLGAGGFEGLLSEVGGVVDDLVAGLPEGVNLSVVIDDLLGLDLDAIIDIEDLGAGGLLGGILGGLGGILLPGGSTSENPISDLLGDVGATVDGLLAQLLGGGGGGGGLGGLSGITATLQNLLTDVGGGLQDLLNGGPLTSNLLDALSELQTNLLSTTALDDIVEQLDLLNGTDNQLIDSVRELLDDLLAQLNALLGGVIDGGEGNPDPNHNLRSDILGSVGKIVVRNDIQNTFLNIAGNLNGPSIRGNLVGGDLFANGGQILVGGNLGALIVGKNIIGGEMAGSGSVVVNGASKVISVGGAVVGGDGVSSGAIDLNGDLRVLRVGRDVVGGDGTHSGSIINDNGRIGTSLFRGSLIAGEGEDTAALRATSDLQAVRVVGSLIGDVDHRVEISAGGLERKIGNKNVAINKFVVGGSSQFVDLLAGYDDDLEAINGDAQINGIVVGRSVVGTNLVAGVQTSNGDTEGFGTTGDRVIGGDDNANAITAKIANILIRGGVLSTQETTDQFGFVSQQLGRLQVALGRTIFNPNATDTAVNVTVDTKAQEVTQVSSNT